MKTGTTRPLARKTLIVSSQKRPLGVLVVARGGDGVVAVLGDQQHAVHGQPAGAEGEGVGDGRLDREPVRGGQQPADVVRRPLVGVERRQLQRRVSAGAVEHVGQQQAADDDVGVGVVAVLGHDGGDPPGRRLVGWAGVPLARRGDGARTDGRCGLIEAPVSWAWGR